MKELNVALVARVTPARGVVVIEIVGDGLTSGDGPASPSSRRLSQQYRTKLKSLDVLLSQTGEPEHRAGRCTRLSFCSLFFSCYGPACSLPTSFPFHFPVPSLLSSSSLISFLCPIFSCSPSFPALCCLFLLSAPLSSFSPPFLCPLSALMADASLPLGSACSHDTYLLPVRLLPGTPEQ